MMESPGSWVGKLLKSIQAIELLTDLAKFIYTLATYRGLRGARTTASMGFGRSIASSAFWLNFYLGISQVGRLMHYVPRAVMVGYINALAILLFKAQLPHLLDVPPAVYGITAISLAIIYILPRFTTAIPSPLVALVITTIAVITLDIQVPTVGDMGELPTALPPFALPQVPPTLETLRIILPYSLSLALVGLLASFLTASLVDELTDTPSDQNREARGQGIANMVTSCCGGMAGCGMIGQSVINVQSGGRGRLSTLSAGLCLLGAMLVFSGWVQRMPMGALVFVDQVLQEDGTHRIYRVSGQIFFLSVAPVLAAIDFTEVVDRVTLDLSHAHLWDQGAVETLAKILTKFRQRGIAATVVGLNWPSAALVQRLGITFTPGPGSGIA